MQVKIQFDYSINRLISLYVEPAKHVQQKKQQQHRN